MITKRVKVFVIKKELGDHKVRPAIHLGLEALPIHLASFGTGNVSLGEARDANAEFTARVHVLNQFKGKLETALGLHERLLTGRWIPAQRQNVLNVTISRVIEKATDIRRSATHAGEVRHGRHTVLLLQGLHDVESLIASAAAGTIGHRKKSGINRL